MFFHVFAQTTHVVAARHGFACVGIPATRLYIPSFIESRSRVSEPQGVKIWLFPLLWLVAFTTACTTVQAVIHITACTVVQAVVKANSQSNGKGQILTPWGSEIPERISMKLGIYNHVEGMPTHANPCRAATTWVVWANT